MEGLVIFFSFVWMIREILISTSTREIQISTRRRSLQRTFSILTRGPSNLFEIVIFMPEDSLAIKTSFLFLGETGWSFPSHSHCYWIFSVNEAIRTLCFERQKISSLLLAFIREWANYNSIPSYGFCYLVIVVYLVKL